MNALSLFSGVGGIELGFEAAGIHVGMLVESDPACQKVLAHHWPTVHQQKDVRDVTAESVVTAMGRPDIIAGGFPCQDVSTAGRRAGLAGQQSSLYAEFVRLADQLDPDWLVVENVPGLLSSEDGQDFACVLGGLTGWDPEPPDSGWRNSGICVGPFRSAAWRVLDAQYFRVPQRRCRVFIVCHSRNRAAPATVLFEPESGTGDSSPGSQTRPHIPTRPAAGAGNTRIVSTLQAGPRGHCVETAGQRWDGDTETFIPHRVTHTLTAEGADASEDGTGRGTPIVPVTFTENQRGKITTSIITGACQTGGGKPGQGYQAAMQSQSQVRRLTPLECERLMGWPDNHTLVPGASDSTRYKQCGNGVAAPVAEWIGRQIIAWQQGQQP